MNELQLRARQFVIREVPASLDYASGSIAEKCIATYAETGKVSIGPELTELSRLLMLESDFSVNQASGGEAEYLRERYEILQQILTQSDK